MFTYIHITFRTEHLHYYHYYIMTRKIQHNRLMRVNVRIMLVVKIIKQKRFDQGQGGCTETERHCG